MSLPPIPSPLAPPLPPPESLLPPPAGPQLSPELRTGIFYSTLYLTSGAAGAYAAIWMAAKGISTSEIGIINSLPVLIMLVGNALVGRIADRASDWRQVIVIGAVLAGIFPIGLFFVRDFWGVLIFWTLAAIPLSAIAPVVDAATVRLTRRTGGDFATLRAWGTVGHTLVIGSTGFLASWLGVDFFLVIFVGVSLLRGLASLLLPKFRAPETRAGPPPVHVGLKIRELLAPWFFLPVFAFAIILATHIMLSAFAALIWIQSGIPEYVIGPLLALGAISEFVAMFAFRRFARKISARNLILVSALASALRWTLMSTNPPFMALIALQLLHGITFGVGYLGSLNFIANWTREENAAEAQSLSVVLAQGTAVIAVLGFGFLFNAMGISAYWIAGLASLIAAGMVIVSLGLKHRHNEESGPA